MTKKRFRKTTLFQFSLGTTPKIRMSKAIATKKLSSLYKIQSFVTSGGKPRTSHPYFKVAGGLLGSTGAKIRTKVKLSEKLSYGDRRQLKETLKRQGFEEKWKSRMGTAWSGAYYEKIDFEHRSVKAQTKEEKQRVKQQWLEYHKERLEPFVKIALEYGDY